MQVLLKQEQLLIIHTGDAFVVSSTSLSSGTDDFVAITNAEIATAYEKFSDTETVDISLLICGPSANKC